MSDPDRPGQADAARGNGAARLGASARPAWNKDIKSYYDAIASEPIPEDIQALMAVLAKSIRS